jgi:MYXO-CTERM domain-containing protein
MKRSLSTAVVLAAISTSSLVAHAGTATSMRQGHWCGTSQVMPQNAPDFKPQPAAPKTRVIFLNRMGGTYQVAASTNSAAGTVSRREFGGTSVKIPPMSNRFNWTTVSACVKNHYKAYNVRFVETRPTSGVYVEAVVGGDGSEVQAGGGGGGLLGIAAADNFCGVTEAGIAFSFAEAHQGIGQDDAELCGTVAHELGHVLSLEHEILAKDLMSYVPITQSSTKAFVSQESACGTDSQNVLDCTCPTTSSNRTNSGVRILAALGTKSTETVPPTITLDSPKGNATLGPSFTVKATAADNTAIDVVTLFVDGVEAGNDIVADTGGKYAVDTKNLSDGTHAIVMEATDSSGNATRTASINVTVAKQVTGGDCLNNTDCTGNVCADDGTRKFCTQACTIANDTCPSGFNCVAVGAGFDCYFAPDNGVCGCQTDGNSTGVALLGALMLGTVLVRKRRRS